MTHDELLAKIGNPIDEGYQYGDIVFNKALRAVVELHKPEPFSLVTSEFICAGCDNRCGCYEGDILGYNDWSTCPTIQAIKKELSNG